MSCLRIVDYCVGSGLVYGNGTELTSLHHVPHLVDGMSDVSGRQIAHHVSYARMAHEKVYRRQCVLRILVIQNGQSKSAAFSVV